MAVEIREVIVRAILQDEPEAHTASPAGGSQGGSSAAEDPCSQGQSPETVVGNVVDQVLRILERRKLR
jgi:hypothetical protein